MLKFIGTVLLTMSFAQAPVAFAKEPGDQTPVVRSSMEQMIQLLKAKKTDELMQKYIDPKMQDQIKSIKRYDQTIELWKGKAGDDMAKGLTSCVLKALAFTDAGKIATCKIDEGTSMVFHLTDGRWRLGN